MKPTPHELAEAIQYDSDTGKMYWKREVRTGHHQTRLLFKVGDEIVGSWCKGYWRICFKNRKYDAHLVAWALTHGSWPAKEVDHINGDKADNRIANLRLATRRQQLANTKRGSRNKSGFKGVSWHAAKNRWQAHLAHRYLGLFTTAEEAHEAYKRAAKELYGEFANDGIPKS